MTSRGDFLDDLLALSRRGALSEAEQRRLREALPADPEARLLLQAGRAFDDEAPVQAGDDALIERMARRVERAARPSRRMPRWAIARAALAGAFAAGIAMATVEHFRAQPPAPPAAPTALATPALSLPPTAPAARSGLAPSENVPSESATPNAPNAPSAPSNVTAPSATPNANTAAAAASATAHRLAAPSAVPASGSARAEFPDAPAESEPAANASELFSAANRARVSGDLARASGLYRRLEELFPASSEALASRLTLGMLLLKQGEAGGALDAFRAYLAHGGGATRAEALWGEAQALRQLGRASEEREALEQLLASYPRSAYGGAAQKRMLELH